MKKKLLSLVAGIALISVLAGCGGGTTAPSASPATSPAAGAQDPGTNPQPATNDGGSKGVIAYAGKTLDHYFHTALHESIRYAAEAKGYTFEGAVANQDSAKQTDQFNNFISKTPTAILANPVDSASMVDVVAQAMNKDIPVAIVDTPLAGGNVIVTVAFDNKQAGVMAAEEIVKRLKEKYGSEKGTVVNAYGAMTSQAWMLRKEGFEEVMAKYPEINYVAVPGEGDMTKTQEGLTNAILQHKTVDAVHCPSDSPGRGLIEALKLANMWKKVGEEGHVIFVTIDGEPVAVDNIKEGYFDASIVQDALSYGPIAIELIEKYTLNGEKVPTTGIYENANYYWQKAQFTTNDSGAYVVVPPYVMDKSNVEDKRHWGTIAVEELGLVYN